MANYITCKDTRSFAYSETTNKGYYELLSVSEDGITCTVKCVYHENKELVGKEYQLLNERITEDFEAVDEVKVYAALEQVMLNETGWKVRGTTVHPHSNMVHNNVDNDANTNTNIWNASIYKDTRQFFYIPKEDAVEFPRGEFFYYNGAKSAVEDCVRMVKYMFDRNYFKPSEAILVVEDSMFDEAITAMTEAFGSASIDLPAELKMQLRSKEYKAVVFHKDNVFIYVTNVRCDHIVFASMIYTAELMGQPLPEAAKAALLARNQEAYNAAIYANIEAVVAGIEARAKEKMFADFSSKFGELTLQPLKNSVHSYERDYEDRLQQLQNTLNKLKEARERLFYAEHGVSTGSDEFVAFINDIKDNLVSIKIYDGNIHFCVRTFLTYWDEELWEIFRKSDYGFSRLKTWQKCLMDDIFTSRSVKLMFEQKFYFNFRHNAACRLTDYDNTIGEGTRGIPNPHIDQYDCWGTHKSHINKYITEFDCTQAYSQAVACISGLTLSDSTVVNTFLNWLSKDWAQKRPCLYVVETGEYITMKEYQNRNKDRKWEE